MVLLVGFVATTAWAKFNKRRDQDSQDWTGDAGAEGEKTLLEEHLPWVKTAIDMVSQTKKEQ